MNVDFSSVSNKHKISIASFTDDQKKAYNDLIDFINKPFSETDFKRALVGPAGTGKTYLVKALIENSSIVYSNIGLSAPTHKACRVLQEAVGINYIKVNTLQSDLGLRLNCDLEKFDYKHPNFDPRGKIKIGLYKIYMIDEASMINRGLLKFIERICIQNGCKIIYIGDDSQLAPVGETSALAFSGVKTNKLTQVVRQGDDNPISELLELLRYDIKHKTFKFLEFISVNKYKFNSDNTKGFQVVNSRQFSDIVLNNFNDKEYTKNIELSKVIAYTNVQVNNWNNFIRHNIIKDSDISVLTKNDLITSYVTIVNVFNEAVIKNSEDYIVNDIVNYVHPKLNLKGFMVKFTAIHGGRITKPLFIVDHTDSFTMQMYVKIANSLIDSAKSATATTRVTKWREYFNFKNSCLLLTNIVNSSGKIVFNRDLDYGFALTAHKSQGSTFSTALVDVNDICYDKYGVPYRNCEEMNRRLYVACSRAKDKLFLKYGL
uniref:ATP dependent DNA helicase DDA n=1 Tax=Geladintestivirus 1 TaxID=3233133 RepID=A0AAU8ML68_9CAUD